MKVRLVCIWVIYCGILNCCYGQMDPPSFLTDFENVTASEGSIVKLPCESVGFPKPQTTWKHNNVTVTSQRGKPRRKITGTGTLRFRPVKVTDEGWYQCSVKNEYGNDTSPRIFLKVEVPAKIVEKPKSAVKHWGSTVTLRCRVQGHPQPHFEWRKDGLVIPDPVTGKLHTSPELVVNVTENATYTCKTHNILSYGLEQDEASATLSYYEYTRPLGYCSSEIAAVCSEHVAGSHPVFHSLDHSIDDISAILNYIFKNVLSTYDPVCRQTMQTLLCHHAFPKCQLGQNQLHEPKPLCRESCIQVTRVFCPDVDWEDLQYHAAFHKELQASEGDVPSLDKYKWAYISPKYCHTLPVIDPQPQDTNTSHQANNQIHPQDSIEYKGDESKNVSEEYNSRAPNYIMEQFTDNECTEMTFDFVAGQLPPEMCYTDNGESYRGRLNITETGSTCKAWSEYKDRTSLTLLDEWSKNYCRNPGGVKERPWCYIHSERPENQQWQYCPLVKCFQIDDRDIINTGNRIEHPEQNVFTQKFLLILGIVFACGVGCLCIVFIIFQRTCRGRRHSNNAFRDYLKPTKQDQMLKSFSIDTAMMSKNGFYHQRLSSVSSNGKLERLEFPRNEITYLEDIAEGAFGKVFKGQASCFTRGNFETQFVAVKTLRENCIAYLEEEMIKEAELMVELDHPNIIRLLGVCLQEKPMCIFYEYMNEGDLQGFLRRKAPPQFPVKRTSLETQKTCLSALELLDIGKQICSGMMYLASHGFVHRDLATRNCLITDKLVVKISDFALIQSTEFKNYFRGKDYDPVPIRWMPLEALQMNEFTTFSDVWSFGIVLWEIFSFGQQPYYGLSTEEVLDFLKLGRVLPPPEDSPKEVYAIMKQCWNYKAQERPSFSSLYSALSCCRHELKDKSQVSL